MIDIVRKCYEEVDIPFDERNIDRAHRIGKTYREKDGDKTFKSIFVKFRSWKSRLTFYRARPKGYEKGVKKPGQRLFSVSVDLTNRRYQLLDKAKGDIEGNANVQFAFADVNCSLGLMFNDKSIQYFNSDVELLKLIGGF